MEYTISTIAPIVLLPFFAFVINAFIVKRFTTLAVIISCASIVGSFFYAARVFFDFLNVFSADYYIHKTFTWFDLSYGSFPFKMDMGIYIDNMTATMLFMVTGVASLIHIFSTYYMHDDKRYGRFFVYLSLFTSAMLALVLSENLISVFIFWELMGFCSYSLIGFYYEKEGAGNASMKAFMTTRVGDVFFLLGILAIWSVVGSVSFVDIYQAIGMGKFNGLYALGIPLATFAGFSVFMGTIGKSAQFPLQVWLPDAMFGPTPCSALIHAATMVAAGVYLSLRCYPLMEAGHLTTFIAYIGGITAFGAATIALVQTDIKAVLAYSTISQLGYMVLGVGVGSYNAAFMHLITHAVFKACLFLSAGSVIHSLHDHHTHAHVQEMPRMGGLKSKMPYTFLAMLFCTLAIAGIPFFSGFVSKDRILGDALLMALDNKVYWVPAVLGFGGALLTAFYMFRMMFLTFFGEPRDKELFDHTKKETLSWNRNLPLLILSLFTLGAFYSGSLTGQGFIKVAGEKYEWFQTLIEKPNLLKFNNKESQAFGFASNPSSETFQKSKYDSNHGLSAEKAHHVHHVHHIGALISIVIAFSGVFIAAMMYFWRSWNPGFWVSLFSRWYRALQNKYYFDDLYIKGFIQKGLLPLNNFLAFVDMGIYDRYAVDGWEKVNRVMFTMAKWFDNIIVDTVAVDGTGASVRFFNVILRTIQSGKIQFYFIMIILVLTGYIWTLNI
ncbi:MAG: NADH-quinone oxidoreductase subunit L [Bacteriovoracaceae bacterium]|nr:NADH-quinone oxidoreductase subunit L [Bacteriovoracaceae bacterium]